MTFLHLLGTLSVLIQFIQPHSSAPLRDLRQKGGRGILNLDYRDARPIYEQGRDGLRRLMVTGVIREGEKLPSVRALASSLAINPNTIQRAYESLEAEGYVCSVPGKGSFAAPHTGVDQGRRDSLLGRFDTVTAELLYLGVTGEQLTSRVRAMEGGEAQ